MSGLRERVIRLAAAVDGGELRRHLLAALEPDRFYGLDLSRVVDIIDEGGDFDARVQRGGRTVEVYNASGKRKYGEVYQNRDHSWSVRMPGGSPAVERLIKRLTEAAGPAPSGSKVDLEAVAAAVRRGDARRHYSDEDILAAVRMGLVSESEAMNQDF